MASYLHAPKFFLDNYDISLTLIGLTLLALRCLDFIQDPLIGRALDSMRKWHSLLVLIMGMIITFSMMALFAVSAIGDPLIWFIVWMILLFSSFSVLSILGGGLWAVSPSARRLGRKRGGGLDGRSRRVRDALLGGREGAV